MDIPAILFPHIHIEPAAIERIGSRFDRLIVCRPWFMDEPVRTGMGDRPPRVEIIRPAEALKPRAEFRHLLTEYRNWIREQRDRGLASFLTATRDGIFSEESCWDIRRMIREGGRAPDASPEDPGLKWHLILHLAREFEKNRAEVATLLHRLRKTGSLLQEALGEETAGPGPFEDLPPSGEAPVDEELLMGRVFEAWFGLFNDRIPGDGTLVTLDGSVMIHARGILEDLAERFPADRGPLREIRFPRQGMHHTDTILSGFSGKTLVLVEAPDPHE